jgi:hypothetical protein
MNRTPIFALAAVMVLAVLLVAIVPAFAADDTVKGKVKNVNVDQNQFTLLDDNNKDLTFTLEKDGKVLLNDKAGKIADLKADDMVTVKYEKKDGKLMATEIHATRK